MDTKMIALISFIVFAVVLIITITLFELKFDQGTGANVGYSLAISVGAALAAGFILYQFRSVTVQVPAAAPAQFASAVFSTVTPSPTNSDATARVTP